MAKKIRGNGDGPNGENQSYRLGSETISRRQLVKEVCKGEHPGYHTVNVDGTKYVRANPDKRKGNNVDQD